MTTNDTTVTTVVTDVTEAINGFTNTYEFFSSLNNINGNANFEFSIVDFDMTTSSINYHTNETNHKHFNTVP